LKVWLVKGSANHSAVCAVGKFKGTLDQKRCRLPPRSLRASPSSLPVGSPPVVDPVTEVPAHILLPPAHRHSTPTSPGVHLACEAPFRRWGSGYPDPPTFLFRRRRRRRSLFRIIHARGAIPNEMGPTRCRATPALNQSADEIGKGGGGGGVYSESYTREEEFIFTVGPTTAPL
jgi:hypothetical protein